MNSTTLTCYSTASAIALGGGWKIKERSIKLLKTGKIALGLIALCISGQVIANCKKDSDCKPGYVCKKDKNTQKKKCVRDTNPMPERDVNGVLRGPRPVVSTSESPAGYREITPVLVPRPVGSRPVRIISGRE